MPGTPVASADEIAGTAERLGFPLILKAAAGGGGSLSGVPALKSEGTRRDASAKARVVVGFMSCHLRSVGVR